MIISKQTSQNNYLRVVVLGYTLGGRVHLVGEYSTIKCQYLVIVRLCIIVEALCFMLFWDSCIKRRLLVPDLVMCYSRNAQHEWMKLKKSRKQKCGILKRCANDFSQKKRIQIIWNIGIG